MTDRPERIEKWSGDIWGGDPKVRMSGKIPTPADKAIMVSSTNGLMPCNGPKTTGTRNVRNEG